jgi:hypothetical protein
LATAQFAQHRVLHAVAFECNFIAGFHLTFAGVEQQQLCHDGVLLAL